MTTTTKLDAALELAAMGFHVFPLVPNSKLPAIDAWQDRATRDAERIKAWWTDPVMGFLHDYNVGICTTRYGDDKALLVIDVDNKEGKHGDDEILKLEMAGFDFPATLTAHTPTGGRHLIYLVDAPLRQGTNVFAPGLDTRSSGGYIVGVGSTTDRGAYAWAPGGNRSTSAPTWCVERLDRAVATRRGMGNTQESKADPTRAAARVLRYLESAPPAVQGAGGDETTYKVAAKLKDLGVDASTALALLLEHWNDKCSPPWSPDELERKVANAYKYGRDEIGSAAPEAQFEPVEQQGEHPFEKINKEFAFVIAGGGHHILWETKDERGNDKLEHLNVATFHAKFAARHIRVGKKSQPVTEAWMESERRRSYDGICFMPGQDAPERFYNLWRGFAVEPWPKGEAPTTQMQDAVSMFLDHARENVCRGDDSLFKWLIGYFAHMVQKPWEKPLVALVFRGGKGVGKNALIERVGYLLGNHFLLTSKRRYLISNFNGHLERLLLFTLDEAFWSGDKQAEGTLKDLITGKGHVIEHKGKEPYTVDNRTRIAIIGNEDWLVPASHDERRFAVFDVGDGRKQDRNYFQSMREGMECGGYRLLLRYLSNVDLSGLDFNQAPTTRGLLDQKHASLDPFQQWWLDSLLEGHLVGSDFAGWPETIETERFRAAFRRYVKERNIRSRVPEDRAIGRLLKQCAPEHTKKRERRGEDLLYVYTFPLLEACREAWDIFIGHRTEWEL